MAKTDADKIKDYDRLQKSYNKLLKCQRVCAKRLSNLREDARVPKNSSYQLLATYEEGAALQRAYKDFEELSASIFAEK